MLRDGKTLDQFSADKYVGTAYVLDCSDLAGKEIPKARLQLHASEIEAADFLLFYTGWEKYWGSEQYFSPFPVLSLEAAEYLAAFRSRASAPTPSPSTRWTRWTILCTRSCSAQAL